jgi:hypothetical protein
MINNKFNMKQLQRSAIAVAVSMCFASMAYAQNADGTIFGRAKAKEQIQVANIETGATRTIESDKDGNFTFTKLPVGRYKITAGSKTREVSVAIGSGTEVKFDDVTTVTVTASRTRNPIDVSSSESNTVFSLAEIQALPVGRNATAVSLLAPGTVKGDTAFGNLASFSGASVAENGYYINGFDVTNMRNFTNYASLPFEAISQEQVKTGGYGAEFGRSLGGIVSLSTKRGTNTWKGGVSVNWDPKWAIASEKSVKNLDPIQSKNPDAPEEFNQAYLLYNKDKTNNQLYFNVYAGGPIIKDKLFVFGLIEGKRNQRDSFSGASANGQYSTRTKEETPNGMIKLDWQISDDHRLEFTGISNKRREDVTKWTNEEFMDRYTSKRMGKPTVYSFDTGGDTEMLKYTGYITDSLTVTAQIGRLFTLNGRTNDPDNWGADCPAIYFGGAWQGGCFNPLHPTVRDPKAPDDSDTRKGKRLDLEYMIGNHTIRAGWDGQDFTSTSAGVTYSGGIYHRYYPMPANRKINGVDGAGTSGNTEYVRVRKYQTSSGSYLVKNDAMYVEDTWKIVPQVMVYAGVRSESFDNKNGDGVSFVNRKNLLAPRLGAAWDVNGDASLKVYGNAGRYYIPVASNSNIRMSQASFDGYTFHNFSGKDPRTMAALNLGPAIGSAFSTGSLTAPNPGTVADTKLTPMSQDEFILGFQKALAQNWVVGVKGVYRKVNDGMDDYCGLTSIYKWAQANGYKNWSADNSASCILMNPGRPLNIRIDAEGDGKLVDVSIPASALGLPKYTRTYKALELSLQRPFDGKWGMTGNYVYSVGKGTAEGYVQSDLGQEDAGITQDFDFGDMMKGSYGTLPNNRIHQIKLYGNYALNDQWLLGANFSAASGRHTSCLGYLPVTSPDYPNPGDAAQGGASQWGASSYYCLNDQGTPILGSRGNGKILPWTKQLDLSVSYTLKLDSGRTLTFRANLFNLFNDQTVLGINQVRDYSRSTSQNATGNQLSPNYQQPTSFTSSRRASFTARYDF